MTASQGIPRKRVLTAKQENDYFEYLAGKITTAELSRRFDTSRPQASNMGHQLAQQLFMEGKLVRRNKPGTEQEETTKDE